VSQKRKEKIWGLVLVIWSLIAVFALGMLDLEPQIRPVGSYEPPLIGQVVGVVVFLLVAKKYATLKGWW